MIVIDASVAVKFLVQEPGSTEALKLIDQGNALVAPDWLLLEVASALWEKVKNSEVLEVHASRNLEVLSTFFDLIEPAADYADDALQLGFRLRHPVYDCVYLSMAIRHRTHVVTADRRFAAAAESAGFGEQVQRLTW